MSNGIENRKQELLEELDKLKFEFKVELPQKIAEAREHGDLKENADYHAARERQGFVKARIAQVNEQMARLNSISSQDIPVDCVGFGTTVALKDMITADELTLTFVTDAESNPSEGKISMSTPYGKALLGKKAGQEIEVNTPVGVKKFILHSFTTIHGTSFSME